MVKSFNASNITNSSVTLEWTAPDGPQNNSYNIIVLEGTTVVQNHTTSINDKSYQVNTLNPGVNYNFTIYTSDSGILSEPAWIEKTTRPNVVSIIKVTGVTNTTVSLEWTTPSDPNHSGYTYEISVSPNSNPSGLFNTTENKYSVSGLQPGTNYTFTITTWTPNGINSSDNPSESATTRPNVVSLIKVTGVTNNTVSLEWTAPSDPNHSGYTYEISVSPNSNPSGLFNTSENKYSVSGLQPGTNYTFTITTWTPNGINSSDNPIISATTRPNVVTSIKVIGGTNTTVSLEWTVPSDPNSSGYTYEISVSPNSNPSGLFKTSDNKYNVSGLQPGTNYTFTITTWTPNGINSSDNPFESTTTRPNVVSIIKVTGKTNTTVSLEWTAPSDPNHLGYTYEISVSSNSNSSGLFKTNDNKYSVSGLQPGTNYTFTITTWTPNGINSSDNPSESATTRPNVVSHIKVTGKSVSGVSLEWTIPLDTYRSGYTYEISVSPNSDPSGPFKTIDNIYNVPGLQPGANYTFIITTWTPNGINSSDNPYESTTTLPNRPTIVNGSAVNTTTISLSWNAPSDPNVKFYKYRVICSLINGANTTTEETNRTNTLISSLSPSYLYNVSLSSLISDVESVASQILLQTQPEIANDLSIDNITSTNVSFSWICPPRATGVQIKATTGGKTENEVNQTCSPGVNEYKLKNLIPGNFYEFSLRTFTTTNANSRRRRRSPTDSITTYSEPYIKTEQMEPATASGLHCSRLAGGYGLKVLFDCPEGNVSKLNIMVDNYEKVTSTNCTGSETVNGLQPAYGYNIMVQTVTDPKIASSDIIICRTDDVGVIVGAIVGVLLFLLLVGLIAFFILKKRRSKDPNILMPVKLSQKRSYTITKEKFQDYYQKNHADSDFGFAEEYQELSAVGTKQSKRAAENPENRAKNRFTNVLPYDHSRVKLDCIDGNPNSDYINANYMPGYTSNKEFIASQGPLPNTTTDFWRMIWEHHVNTIVMLTNCTENGRVKCEHYWPLDYTPCTYEDITVTVTSETILPEWTIRDFSLKNARQQGVKYVRHFHFTVWPDHGVPENTTNIIQFRNLVREHMDQRKSTGPTIVHCSAGVGRTGTLIALDYLIQQMEKEHRIGVYGFVEKMRMNRPLMVQTESQYVFLNKCLLSLIEQPAEENIYENNVNDLIYENASVIRNFNSENA
ncbi:receptor-type tyrosine- phosphatase H isoform X2 [Pelobates cultripes]|uniref:protein-tyrosine-phosphatase n=1 Tax=Pelobates cultripes TaxID=61616 RepID=A0AAD1T901_PELCU|nr:receptor-type tyrosine- phosphatase H isoform X2 [Pelobates cultripes]